MFTYAAILTESRPLVPFHFPSPHACDTEYGITRAALSQVKRYAKNIFSSFSLTLKR